MFYDKIREEMDRHESGSVAYQVLSIFLRQPKEVGDTDYSVPLNLNFPHHRRMYNNAVYECFNEYLKRIPATKRDEAEKWLNDGWDLLNSQTGD
jgi:hypothetical protein